MPNWKKIIVSGSDASLNSLIVATNVNAQSFTGSLLGTSSYSNQSLSSSYSVTASYALNGGGGSIEAFPYTGSAQITGSLGVTGSLQVTNNITASNALITNDVVVQGRVTAQEFYTEFVTASVIYESGSTKFGNSLDDTHDITGSLRVTGSATINNYRLPLTDGVDGQVMLTDGDGLVVFDDVKVYAQVKNISGTTLYKGTPLHATASASPPSGNVSEVIAASASLASAMPATFILAEDLNDGEEGKAISVGYISGVDTSGFTVGDIVYVGVNGGYTNQKPTGSNLIQNLGVVTRVDASNGAGFIYGSGRTNAVPNLLNGEIFWGEGDTAIQKPLADIISGSNFAYSGSFTGSLFGTASYANQSLSSSYAITSSYAFQTLSSSFAQQSLSSSYSITSSFAIQASSSSYSNQSLSSSYALTASYALNGGSGGSAFPFTGDASISGSLQITGSLLISESLFQYADNTDVDTGTETVLSIATGSYRAAFFDYVAVNGTNTRAGTVTAVWNGSNIQYTEVSTADIGNTENCNLQVVLSSGNAVLQARVLSNNWSVKALARLL